MKEDESLKADLIMNLEGKLQEKSQEIVKSKDQFEQRIFSLESELDELQKEHKSEMEQRNKFEK